MFKFLSSLTKRMFSDGDLPTYIISLACLVAFTFFFVRPDDICLARSLVLFIFWAIVILCRSSPDNIIASTARLLVQSIDHLPQSVVIPVFLVFFLFLHGCPCARNDGLARAAEGSAGWFSQFMAEHKESAESVEGPVQRAMNKIMSVFGARTPRSQPMSSRANSSNASNQKAASVSSSNVKGSKRPSAKKSEGEAQVKSEREGKKPVQESPPQSKEKSVADAKSLKSLAVSEGKGRVVMRSPTEGLSNAVAVLVEKKSKFLHFLGLQFHDIVNRTCLSTFPYLPTGLENASYPDLLLIQNLIERYDAQMVRPSQNAADPPQPATKFVRGSTGHPFSRGSCLSHSDQSADGPIGFTYLDCNPLSSGPSSRMFVNRATSSELSSYPTICSPCCQPWSEDSLESTSTTTSSSSLATSRNVRKRGLWHVRCDSSFLSAEQTCMPCRHLSSADKRRRRKSDWAHHILFYLAVIILSVKLWNKEAI